MDSERHNAGQSKPLSGLTGRILLSFVLVSVVAVGVVALLANRVTTHQFELYVSSGRQMRLEQLVPYFSAFYADMGSWNGVEVLMETLNNSSTMGGPGMGMGRGRPFNMSPMMSVNTPDRLILADINGKVVADSEEELTGEVLSPTVLENGMVIPSGGIPVGILLLTVPGTTLDPLQEQFFNQINRSLLWAGLGSALVAIVIGFFLARRLTAPLRILTEAVERMSKGNLKQQVTLRGDDEIAELGKAFNRMASSLAEQEELRRNLMADVAHELRTPLAVIRSDLEALLDGIYEVTPETLTSLQDETILLSRLVDDLRALSLAEAGQLQLKREQVSLRNILAAEVSTFGPIAEMKKVELIWEPPADELKIEADVQRLRQVIANLLSNALRHTPSGGQVKLGVQSHESEVEVSIADTGPGISQEDLPHVFDRFWQSDNTQQAGEGSGLGLAIVKGLVQAHGGSIWVESQSGRGTEFHFSLPKSSS